MNKPFFSIVYPTRNRPHLLKYCLEALSLQTFRDFEVIVCDNYTNSSAKEVFSLYEKDLRFKYITPVGNVSMHDNWEYASSFAKGQYVSVLTDKMVLVPDALMKVYDALQFNPAEVVTWREEFFIPDHNDINTTEYNSGTLHLRFPKKERPFYYDGSEYLKKRFSFDIRRGTEGVAYYWGKICFGFYRRSLIDRIIKKTGKLFWKYSPDYTSMVSALSLSKSFLDMGEALHVVFSVKISNGQQNSTNMQYLLKTCNEMEPDSKFYKLLPFADLVFSLHNFVAIDYMLIKNKLTDDMSEYEINRVNLFIRILEDFTFYKWDDKALLKDYLIKCLHEWYEFSFSERLMILVGLIRFYIKKFIKEMKYRINHFIFYGFLSVIFQKIFHLHKPRRYPNIIEAAKSI